MFCTLPVVRHPHFYYFRYRSMLEYAYCINLSPADKTLFQKCHTFQNELYHYVFQILKQKLVKIYSIFYIWHERLFLKV